MVEEVDFPSFEQNLVTLLEQGKVQLGYRHLTCLEDRQQVCYGWGLCAGMDPREF